MSHLENVVLPSLKLYEYYALDVVREKKAVLAAWGKTAPGPMTKENLHAFSIEERAARFASRALPEGWNLLGERHHAKLDLPRAVGFLQAFLGPNATAEEASEETGRLLDVLNVERYKEWDEDLKAILENTKSRAQYTRIDEHGPRMGEISATYAILSSFPPSPSPSLLFPPSLLVLFAFPFPLPY